MKRKYWILIIWLCLVYGCCTGILRSDFLYEKMYRKKRVGEMDSSVVLSLSPEYYGLKEKISKQEYRILPTHLQKYYGRE